MKINKPLALFLVLGCAVMLAACKTAAPAGKAASGVLYVCGCGPDCKCVTVSTKPGKCGCGKDLVAGSVKRVEADTALLCSCGADCKCALDAKDPSKCSCGKPIRKVSLKGTGIYFCNCGGACDCNTVSDKAGQCKCGMALKKAG